MSSLAYENVHPLVEGVDPRLVVPSKDGILGGGMCVPQDTFGAPWWFLMVFRVRIMSFDMAHVLFTRTLHSTGAGDLVPLLGYLTTDVEQTNVERLQKVATTINTHVVSLIEGYV